MRLTTTKKKEPELFANLDNVDENQYFLKIVDNDKVDDFSKVANKLGQLEDIEDELGIYLTTLFKALKQQKMWTKYNNELDLCEETEYRLLEDYIYFYWDNGKHLVFELKDYGKTWALTREELL